MSALDIGKFDALWDALTPEQQREVIRLAPHLPAAVHSPDTTYQRDPIRWAVEVLGIPEWSIRWSLLPEYAAHPWDGTVDPLARLAEALAEGKDVGVESATGTGKTFEVAWLALWFVVLGRGAGRDHRA